jgi:hypothetical protein
MDLTKIIKWYNWYYRKYKNEWKQAY